MNAQKIVVSIDIGTTKTCVLVGKKSALSKFEILGIGESESEGVTNGIITNINKAAKSIDKAISIAENKANIDIKIVNIGISGSHINSFKQRGSITRDRVDTEIHSNDIRKLNDDMYKLVTPAGKQIIHVMPQDYNVDNETGIKDPVGMSGVKIEGNFYIITGDSVNLNRLTKCTAKRGIEIENTIFHPIASSIAVLNKDEQETGVCIIDFGSGTADIAIFYESVLCYTDVISFGGDIITDDIKQAFGIMPNQAELLKIKFGRAIADMDIDIQNNKFSHNQTPQQGTDVVSIPGIKDRPPKNISTHSLALVIESRLIEIISMIYSSIQSSGFQNKLSGGLVITGGTAKMLYIKELFEYITGFDTRIGYPNEYLEGNFDLATNPIYSTSIGLLLAGFNKLDYRDIEYNEPSRESNIFKKKQFGTSIFKRLLDKTKGLLIDDYVDEN